MKSEFDEVKSVLTTIHRILTVICTLVITLGVLILARSIINAAFLHSYNNGKFSSIPEKILVYLPFGENFVVPYNLGNVEYQRGNYDKAIYYYSMAYSKDTPEHPAHDEVCKIRVNMALSLCHTIDFDNLDTSNKPAVSEAISTLQQARAILTEDGCASEPVGSNDGHFPDADKLKHDIDKMLEQLQNQSDSSDDSQNGGGGGGGDDQNEDQSQDQDQDDQQNQDEQDQRSRSQKDQEEQERQERARQEQLKEELDQQKEDLKDSSSSRYYDYEYIDGGDAQGYGDGTLW